MSSFADYVDEAGITRLRASSDATPAVQVASVTLTDAQIKNLVTGSAPYAVIVASPGSGYAALPIHWTARAHVVDAYTGLDPSPIMLLAAGNALTQIAEQMDPTPLLGSTNDALSSGHDFEQAGVPITFLDDQPLNLIVGPYGAALGGGNAANTLTVTVLYRVVAV